MSQEAAFVLDVVTKEARVMKRLGLSNSSATPAAADLDQCLREFAQRPVADLYWSSVSCEWRVL